MRAKPSRSFLLAITSLVILTGWYWWVHSGSALWMNWQTQRRGSTMIKRVLGPNLPPSLKITAFSDGSDFRHPCGMAGKIARDDFNHHLLRDKWTEIPIPRELLGPMHLSPDTPRGYLTCFSGQLAQGPAKLLWSDYTEDFSLYVDPPLIPVAP